MVVPPRKAHVIIGSCQLERRRQAARSLAQPRSKMALLRANWQPSHKLHHSPWATGLGCHALTGAWRASPAHLALLSGSVLSAQGATQGAGAKCQRAVRAGMVSNYMERQHRHKLGNTQGNLDYMPTSHTGKSGMSGQHLYAMGYAELRSGRQDDV